LSQVFWSQQQVANTRGVQQVFRNHFCYPSCTTITVISTLTTTFLEQSLSWKLEGDPWQKVSRGCSIRLLQSLHEKTHRKIFKYKGVVVLYTCKTALEKLRQEDWNLKAILGYLMILCLKTSCWIKYIAQKFYPQLNIRQNHIKLVRIRRKKIVMSQARKGEGVRGDFLEEVRWGVLFRQF
jgi:hypothetical protein